MFLTRRVSGVDLRVEILDLVHGGYDGVVGRGSGRERLLGHEGQQAEPLVLVDAVGSGGGYLKILAEGSERLHELVGGHGVAVAAGGGSEGAGAVVYRLSAAGTENAVTAGKSIAFDRPWATWKCAPIGRLMPCTSATLELEKAMPAWVAASIIASRASVSPPSA
jgi:hypothetical protein